MNNNIKTILAIETSCDETGVAVVRKNDGDEFVELLSSQVATSMDMHVKTGGIVPEVAAREQLSSMLPILNRAFDESGLSPKEIDAIAVTQGPGLMGSLLVGVETAKALAMAWDKPLIPIHHLRAHLLANFLENKKNFYPMFPALGMVVSGGHTEVVLMKNASEIEWIGGTRDDASGECFDKCARLLLNTSYPGGPEISRKAREFSPEKYSPTLPRPMLHSHDLEMSFSGLKTAMHNQIKKEGDLSDQRKSELAYDLEQAISDVLIKKLSLAIELHSPKSIMMGGGVLANSVLREKLSELSKNSSLPIHIPDLKHCSDNAVMIGVAAALSDKSTSPLEVFADPGLSW